MLATIERITRNVENWLGMSETTYKKRDEKKISGEIQGKVNVSQRSNLQKTQII